jgi:hypothetical protein
MHKRKIILTSLLIVALVTGWAVYRFFKTPPSDLYNTEFIRVQSGDTGEIWDILKNFWVYLSLQFAASWANTFMRKR